MVRDVVCPLVPADVAHTAELLVSELVTNAVTHGCGRVRLAIDWRNNGLSVTVSDDEPAAPLVRPERLMSTDGRGMRMIETLASAWGVRAHNEGGGKDVWFTLG
jgi:two-component sensor histidine kinase